MNIFENVVAVIAFMLLMRALFVTFIKTLQAIIQIGRHIKYGESFKVSMSAELYQFIFTTTYLFIFFTWLY